MPAHRIISDQQLEMLLSYMEEHRDFACGRVTNKDGAQAKREARERWERLAERLNAVGVGATKTVVKWRDYWNDRKCAIRKRVLEMNAQAKGTGGGPIKKIILTPQDERIRALLRPLPHPTSTRQPALRESPRQSGSSGNDSADELAREGSDQDAVGPEPIVPIKAVEPTAPRWALDMENRRAEAVERRADAAEQQVALLRKMCERQAAANERLLETNERLTDVLSQLFERSDQHQQRVADALEKIQQTMEKFYDI